MKKSIVINLLASIFLLASCGKSPSGEESSQKGYSEPSLPRTSSTYAGNVEVEIYFINGSHTVVEIEKGKKFIVEENFEGFKAYTDDFYSHEYTPSKLNESITLYLREDNGKNVLAIYDIIDDVPSLTSIGTYPSNSGLYPIDSKQYGAE